MTMEEHEKFTNEHPELVQVIAPSGLNYRGFGDPKISSDFNSILKKIKKDFPGSNINTR